MDTKQHLKVTNLIPLILLQTSLVKVKWLLIWIPSLQCEEPTQGSKQTYGLLQKYDLSSSKETGKNKKPSAMEK